MKPLKDALYKRTGQKLLDRAKEHAYIQLVQLKESEAAWAFVLDEERKDIESKLETGWQNWTREEAGELWEVMIAIGKRMMSPIAAV